MLLSHLKWFEDPQSVLAIGISGVEWLIPLIIVGLGLVVFKFIDRYSKELNHKISKKLYPLRPYVSTVVGVTIGLSLIIYSAGGHLFAPNVHIDNSLVLLLEFVIGLSLVLGVFTRFGAGSLLVLYGLSLFVAPIGGMGEHLEYVGGAIFLLIMGSGAWSIDRLIKKDYLPNLKDFHTDALSVFCFFTGLSLAVLAFTEKLLNLKLAEKFLATHQWNLLAVFNVPNHWFIILIGSFELLLGTLIAFRIASRLAIAMLAGVMALTAIILGPAEVGGHLFAIGLTFAIWVGDEKLDKKSKKLLTH